jgi:hypothetical protein
MAKKKKTALKPVARGFATTSQAKKVVPEPSPEETATSEDDAVQQETQDGVAGVDGADKATGVNQAAEAVDWEDDAKLEEGVYQGYVERLQDKGDREVAKILKVSPCNGMGSLSVFILINHGRLLSLTGERTKGTSALTSSRLCEMKSWKPFVSGG